MLPSGLTALTPASTPTASPRGADNAAGAADAPQDDFASLINHSVKRREHLEAASREADSEQAAPAAEARDTAKKAGATAGKPRSLDEQLSEEGVDEPPEVDVTPLAGNVVMVPEAIPPAGSAPATDTVAAEDTAPAAEASSLAAATRDPLKDAASITPIVSAQTDIMATGPKPSTGLDTSSTTRASSRTDASDAQRAVMFPPRAGGAETALATAPSAARRAADVTFANQGRIRLDTAPLDQRHGAPLMNEGPVARSHADYGLQNALTQYSAVSGTAPATPAATVNTLPPLDSEQWDNALAAQIRHMGRAGQGQSVLTLSPATLGKLEVSLDINAQQQANVHFVTQTDAAHDALSSSMESLQHALTQQGVDLQRMSVQHRPDTSLNMGFAFDQSGREQQQESAQKRATPARDTGLTRTDADTEVPVTPTTGAQRLRATA